MFRRRTWLPLPFALALVAVAMSGVTPNRAALSVAPLILLAGEGIRLWAVRHIGVISRTRADRLGPLITTGPFAVVRNPLYVGNLLLWAGMACWVGAPWMALVAWALFGPLYFFITRWEETLLEERHGDAYRDYAGRVGGWLPRLPPVAALLTPPSFSWRETFFSERGTIIAIVVMALLLSLVRM
jgi:protein-S-isoprenylcysteine O-methyltransferase Ste14